MLVGRDSELEAVAGFLAGLSAGPAVLVLAGEAGIGKSVLWEWAMERARAEGVRVLSSRPVAAESALAFAGLTDLLEPVAEEVLPVLSEPQRRALAVALLRETPGGGRLDRRAVSAAVLSVLRVLAGAGRPLLLAIDDLQWLDRPSAAVLEFSLRRLGLLPVGLLACERSEDEAESPLALEPIGAEDRRLRLQLGPLSLAALHEIVKAAVGRSLPRRALARIERMAGGNPFFALELARSLPADLSWVEGLPLPGSLRALVDARVAGLPQRVREALLAAAAVRSPNVETVAAVTGKAVAAARLALERAEAAGIVELDRAGVRFVHPLYAAGVYAAGSPAQRRVVHCRVAGLVDRPEERARHLALAAAGADAELAGVLDEAAESARARGAPEAAAELVEEARRLTPADCTGDAQQRAIRAAEYHLHAGELARARELLDGVLREVASGHPRAQALRLLAELNYHLQSVPQAIPLFEEALEHAGADAALRLTVELQLTFAANLAGDWVGAVPHARRALALAEELQDDARLAEALAVSVILDYLLGRGLDEPRLERALAFEDPERQTAVELRPTLIAGHLMLYEGRLERSCELFSDLRERVLERGQEFDLPFLSSYLAWAECMRGNLAAALRYAEEALEIAARVELDSLQCLALAFSALPLAYAGEAEAARTSADEALALMKETGLLIASIWARWALAVLELSVGDPAATDAALMPLTAQVEAAGIEEPIRAPFLADQIEALVALGELERAQRLTEMLEQAGRRHRRGWVLVQAGRSRALLLAAQGSLEAAAETVEETLRVSGEIEHRLERARTLLVAGQIERRRKNKRHARDHLRAALETFDTAGAKVWAARTRAELRASGDTIPRRAPDAPETLTPQELQVAMLAANGKTNKEIAAALFLSTKTVEFHLSRVYRKLGIRSRTQLATRAASLHPGTTQARETPDAPRPAAI